MFTQKQIEAAAIAIRDYRHRGSRFREDFVVDDEHRNMAAAALAAAGGAAWELIETAPKDRTQKNPLLLADYSGLHSSGTFWISTGWWEKSEIPESERGYWTDGVERLYTPTHWRPSLEVPAELSHGDQ